MQLHRTTGDAGRRRRALAALALCAAVTAVPAAPAAAQVGTAIEVPQGRLTRILTTPDLNCAVSHIDDSSPEFFGDTACATLVATGGTLFGPADIPAGSSASPRTTFTAVSQSGVMGSGTPADPFRIETVVTMPGSPLELRQVDSYVTGQESYRTDVHLRNTGDAGVEARLYRAGDCFLQNSDRGFGRLGPRGAVACVAVDESGTGPGERIEQWLPLTGGSRALHAGYSEVWARIGMQQPFDDTCRCDELIDNGAGLSWDVQVPPAATATFSHLTTFSPLGRVPVTTEKVADRATAQPGQTVRYTIALTNPNADPAQVDAVVDTLPDGFAHVPGTTTGATTADPAVQGQQLTWTGPFTAPAGGTVELSFDARVADAPGTYFNTATASAGDLAVTGTGPTAPVQVVGGDPDVPRIPGDDVQRIAINLCQFLFTEPDLARTVVLARSDVFADALAGAPLAADDSCILYTPGGPDAPLDAATRAELDRVLPDGGLVRIMGGPTAVSAAAEQELAAAGYRIERFQGPTRYETAEAIARRVVSERPGATEAMLASGLNFPDAVTGGAYGAEAAVPILLTPPDALHPAAARALADLGITTTTVLGGEAAVSAAAASAAPGARRVAGPNRMATATAVAGTLWAEVLPGPPAQVVATNLEREDGWALTLASAPLSARNDAPQVGVAADRYPDETRAYLRSLSPPATTAFVIGGVDHISDEVAAAVGDDVGG